MPSPISLTPLAARRFALRALGLEQPFSSVEAALAHLGYVQIDPLNICGRMHDLILRNRVSHYSEGDLMRHLHGAELEASESDELRTPRSRLNPEQRIAFEHHHPETNILVAFPLDAWPHLLGAMQARSRQRGAWAGKLTPTEKALAPQLIEAIRTRGPLSSDEFEDQRHARRSVWGTSTLVKTTLQKLFFHGELLIAERNRHRRRYDLPERVLPAWVRALPQAPVRETKRWIALLKLRQRRLAVLKRDEFAAAEDAVQAIQVENCPTLHCLTEDLPLLESCRAQATDAQPADVGQDSAGDARVRLLAPLDPLIYDRRVTAALWNFDYTWEAYTPAAKRVRGHYALPVLAGTELVDHVEPKADRTVGKLTVASRSVRRGYRVAEALDELAAWLGLRR